jgi:hypothetical protein
VELAKPGAKEKHQPQPRSGLNNFINMVLPGISAEKGHKHQLRFLSASRRIEMTREEAMVVI